MTPADELRDEVARLFAQSTVPLSREGVETLVAYVGLLGEWSGRINLTGFRHPRAVLDGLLYDAVEIAPLIPEGASVLDVGAGAGGLSFALATLRTDVALRLVEPRLKRAVFLRTATRELGLSSKITVMQTRAEDLPETLSDSTEVAYAKAVMPPEQWLELGSSLVRRHGGLVLCLTAAPLDEKSVRLPSTLRVEAVFPYKLPFSQAPRAVTALRTL